MIAALLVLFLAQDAPAKPAPDKAVPVQFPELAVVGYEPKLKGREIWFKIMVKNISPKAVRFGRMSLFPKGFEYNEDGAYVVATYSLREEGKESSVMEAGTDYLRGERSKILYPNDTMEINAALRGCNFPVKDVGATFAFAKGIGGPRALFLINQNGKDLKIETKDVYEEEEKARNAPKEDPNKQKPISKEMAEKLAKEKAARKADISQKIAEKKIQVEAQKNITDKADKIYRDLAKQAIAADKADQFADAKRLKADSLKGYAIWKKEKATLDDLENELQKLEYKLKIRFNRCKRF